MKYNNTTIRGIIHCPGTVDVFNRFEHIKINHNKATHIFVQMKPEIDPSTKIDLSALHSRKGGYKIYIDN